MEEWRPVVGYEGLYEVSSEGRVRSLDRVVSYTSSRASGTVLRFFPSRMLSLRPGMYGYHVVSLGRGNQRTVHSLVCEAFIGPRPLGMQIRHLDGVRTNNRPDNLAYGTPQENSRDKVAHGTMNYGTVNGQSKLNEDIVRKVRSGEMTKHEAALASGCTVSNINYVLLGKTWKHVA